MDGTLTDFHRMWIVVDGTYRHDEKANASIVFQRLTSIVPILIGGSHYFPSQNELAKLFRMEVITCNQEVLATAFSCEVAKRNCCSTRALAQSKAESRLAEYGYDIRDCHALVLSHEHGDHISGVGALHRKFGLPIHANVRTWNATRAKPTTGVIGSPKHFDSGIPFQIGSLRIEPLRTPHDAIEGVCFVIEDTLNGQRFGLLTDLGHVFSGLRRVMGSLDAVLIESNYDETMLHRGPYPQRLRIALLENVGTSRMRMPPNYWIIAKRIGFNGSAWGTYRHKTTPPKLPWRPIEPDMETDSPSFAPIATAQHDSQISSRRNSHCRSKYTGHSSRSGVPQAQDVLFLRHIQFC